MQKITNQSYNVTQTPQLIKISKGTIELYQYFQDMGTKVLAKQKLQEDLNGTYSYNRHF